MYEDVNGDGKIDWSESTADNSGDLRIIGNSLPRYSFGADLTADWKGIDVRLFFHGVLKRDIFQSLLNPVNYTDWAFIQMVTSKVRF